MSEPARIIDTPALDTASATAAGPGSDLTSRTGFRFQVRPAAFDDEAALAEFFTHVDQDDLRFRFLSPIRTVGHDQLAALVAVDHQRTENLLAIDTTTGRVIASAMLVADAAMRNAEVAIAIRADCKHRGISWTLLDHLTRFAISKGIETLESIESRENFEAIEMERERGWKTSPAEGDPSVLVLRMTLASAAV